MSCDELSFLIFMASVFMIIFIWFGLELYLYNGFKSMVIWYGVIILALLIILFFAVWLPKLLCTFGFC